MRQRPEEAARSITSDGSRRDGCEGCAEKRLEARRRGVWRIPSRPITYPHLVHDFDRTVSLRDGS